MQSIHVNYAVTYPEGKVSGDVCGQGIDEIASHFYEGLYSQYSIQPVSFPITFSPYTSVP